MPISPFVLNDESVRTSHGFYLLNAGARFERFRANPVMLDNHCDSQVIGRWRELHAEGGRLIATPEFDTATELGRERQGQVERGFLRGASLGLYILAAEERIDPTTGETRVYVTDWEALEASIVAIPSNAGAVALRVYDADRHPVGDSELPGYLDRIVKLSKSDKTMPNTSITTGTSEPAQVTLSAQAQIALGVPENAPVAEVSAAVVRLAAELHSEKTKREKLEQTIEADRTARAQAMVDLAVKEGRITADKKDAFVKLALADYESTQTALAAMPVKESLSGKVQSPAGGSSIPGERKAWNLHRWMKEDMEGLQRLKADDPDAYAEVVKRV